MDLYEVCDSKVHDDYNCPHKRQEANYANYIRSLDYSLYSSNFCQWIHKQCVIINYMANIISRVECKKRKIRPILPKVESTTSETIEPSGN